MIRSKNGMKCFGKTKSTLIQEMQTHITHNTHKKCLYNGAKLMHKQWHLFLSSLLCKHRKLQTHALRDAQRSVDIKISTYPHHAPVRNHITSTTPISNTHNAAATSTLSNLRECHYTPPQHCVMPAQENNQKKAPIHPKRGQDTISNFSSHPGR